MRSATSLRCALAALAAIAASASMAAPARAEAVSGAVLDRLGAREVAVDRVQIRLCIDPERTRCRSTLTQRDGTFYLDVAPGTYVFVGEMPSGATFTTRVTVVAGRQNHFKIYLPK